MTNENGSKKKIRFHVGGPAFHPVEEQARCIAGWLGDDYEYFYHQDKEVFDHLDDTDLLVVMGLFYSGMEGYIPLSRQNEDSFGRYVAAGKPVLVHHGAAASYDDSDIFKRLIGINWVWGGECPTQHSPIGDYTVRIINRHPVIDRVEDFRICDELYYDLHTVTSIRPETLAVADYEGRALPMIQVFVGGRIEGSGKCVYLANGHDMIAFQAQAMEQIWRNSVNWLLDDNKTDSK